MKIITNTETVNLGNQYRVPKPTRGKLRAYIGSQSTNIGGVDDVDKAYDEIIKASIAGKDVVDLRDTPEVEEKPKRKPRAKAADAAEAKTEVVEDKPPETTA